MDHAIIISSGRCGSTLLSDLIDEEPETCSAQEFLNVLGSWNRSTATLTGPAYWDVLASPKTEMSILLRLGAQPKEFSYPADGRYARDLVNIPRILAITLAKLTDDRDALFDRLAEGVKRFPAQSISAHNRSFLDLLAETTGKRRWVERSGASSMYSPWILENYPEAKIVYLTRDWKATAKSMARHSSFQLAQLQVEARAKYGIDPFDTEFSDELPAEVVQFLPGRLTADFLRKRGDDLNRFVALCAFMTSQAEQALADHLPVHLHRMTYEELLMDPIGQLTSLAEFLGFAEPAEWAVSVAGRVRSPQGVTA